MEQKYGMIVIGRWNGKVGISPRRTFACEVRFACQTNNTASKTVDRLIVDAV